MATQNPKAKSSHAQAAANIKKELVAAFPGIKFSVKSKSFSMGDSVDVSWQFGPTSREVDAIIEKYAYGRFDGYTDSYNYDGDLDGKVFRAANGSAKYVSGQREIPSETFTQICKDIAALFEVEFSDVWQRSPGHTLGLGDYANRALARTSFPAGAEYIGVDWSLELELIGSCLGGDSIRIIHSKTDEDAEMRGLVKSEFDRIRARTEQQSRLTLLCGQATLAPDDLIVPCVLPAGHSGYCDTGRT